MIVWILFLCYLIILKLALGDLNTPTKRRLYLVLAGLGTILVMGLRGYAHDSSEDVAVYKRIFSRVALADWEDIFAVDARLEHGYIIFNKLLSYLSTNSQILVIAEAIVAVVCVSVLIDQCTENVFEAYFFYVTLGSMTFSLTAFRQTFAISLILLSVVAIRKRKLWVFLLLVVLAAQFHKTALVFLVAYPICRIPILRRQKLLLIPSILLIVVMLPVIIQIGSAVLAPGSYDLSDEPTFSFNGIVPILIYAGALIDPLITVNTGEGGELDECTVLTAAGLGLYFIRFYTMILERVAFFYTPCSIIGLSGLTARLRKMEYGLLAELGILAASIALFLYRISGSTLANYVWFWQVT